LALFGGTDNARPPAAQIGRDRRNLTLAGPGVAIYLSPD
jgi:hypothetical protein